LVHRNGAGNSAVSYWGPPDPLMMLIAALAVIWNLFGT
jgi:hypothetical protein